MAPFFTPPSSAEDKVYIDIISAPRKLPIALQELTGPFGKALSAVIKSDLEYSGLFAPIDEESFLELPGQAFSRENWSGIGAEAVVKGYTLQTGSYMNATVYLYDTFEGRTLLKKEYRAKEDLIRPLAHTIANDIYKKLTGQDSVFQSKIAFIKKSEGKHEIALMDWDGERTNGLNVKASILVSPYWSEDGKRLLYSAERNRSWDVYLLDFGRRKEIKVFSSEGTNMAGGFLPGSNGIVLSSSRSGTPDIYTYDISKDKLVRLTNERGIEVSPAVSPDGNTIAFVSDLGGSAQIYTIDKNGYNRNRVTFEGSYNTSPAWSPRGDMLAFSGKSKARNQIFVVRPDGTGLRMLTNSGNNEDPSFSPDGRFIAFTSDRDGSRGIFMMRSNGEGQKRISQWGAEAFAPNWSPVQ